LKDPACKPCESILGSRYFGPAKRWKERVGEACGSPSCGPRSARVVHKMASKGALKKLAIVPKERCAVDNVLSQKPLIRISRPFAHADLLQECVSDTISSFFFMLIAAYAIILLYERLSRHICVERRGIPRLQEDCAWTREFAD
jgi:hypothetical protein